MLLSMCGAALLALFPCFTRAPSAASPAAKQSPAAARKASAQAVNPPRGTSRAVEPGASAGEKKSATTTAPDYSKEPYVYQKILTKVAFENNGTYTYDTVASARIQTEAAVQSLSVIKFSYASAAGTLDVVYVRVRKPDGTVVDTPPDTFQDMPAAITRQAPFYSDLREKQVAVRGLETGDTLEYEYKGAITKPLAPGQFWYEYNFTKDAIVLGEELQVSVPKNRRILVGSGKLKPMQVTEHGRRIYTWNTSHVQEDTRDAATKIRQAFDAPPADVQLTTFPSWDEVGQWYQGLAAPRAVPTPEIRAEAARLTKGLTTNDAKLRAIYNYVSLKFRYVGIAFGIGRYQPHAAADVMGNAYGDCKDKETLLAALLAAVGIKAYPALVNSSHQIDRAVPSPGQFDHVIAAVPEAQGYEWLDTTAEVSPPGFLTVNLRGRQALVIPDSGPAQLVRTPQNPPFQMLQTFTADAKLSGEGTLQSKMETSGQGDGEILLRQLFRDTPQAQWTVLLQALSYRMGFSGEVSDITASPVDSTDPLLKISYDYTRKDYSDWSDRKIVPPLPVMLLPADGTSKTQEPIRLGAPGQVEYSAKVTLPAGYTPELPAPVNLVEDFAEYHSSYAFAKGVLIAKRDLIVKEDKLEPAQQAAYKKFLKGVNDNAGEYVVLDAAGVEAPHPPSAQAEALYNQGRRDWQQQDMADAADAFEKAVTLDPKYGLGWTALGAVHFAMGDRDQGLSEMKKAIEVDPRQTQGYKTLAATEMVMHESEAALKTWRQLEKMDPSDADAPRYIGRVLMIEKRYADALPELETAAKRNPTDSELLMQLAQAELKMGHADKALEACQQAIKLDPSPLYWNDSAYYLADEGKYLDIDLGYAQKAVQQEEQQTATVNLDSLRYADLGGAEFLADYWDTLGWVDFRMGRLEPAEKYLLAAWQVSQDSVNADHLGQLYEKEGKTREAGEYDAYALAAAPTRLLPTPGMPSLERASADNPMPAARKRLVRLLQSEKRANDAVDRARDRLSQLRSIRLPKLTEESADAQFYVVMTVGPKVSAVKFISGDARLETATKDLSSAHFPQTFPDAGPEKILRRGILDCEPQLSYCQFTLFLPRDVRSLN